MAYDTEQTSSHQGSPSVDVGADETHPVNTLTQDWGDPDTVSSYLDRCQVDTPDEVVRSIWTHVKKHRPREIGKVLDLGAGDGRFARHGSYRWYIGYEIDDTKYADVALPTGATLVNECAFSHSTADADVCVGNPPFVRNQDIPTGWREHAHGEVLRRTGVAVPGLANAWQYFFLNALACLKADGLAALVVPFEWVSRPSARALRAYIRDQGWSVSVYRLREAQFTPVLTTASITVVDKAENDGKWEYYEETETGENRRMPSPTGSEVGMLKYLPATDLPETIPKARRGLSPGTQRALTLREEQREQHSLKEGRDVVRCVTSLRHLDANAPELDQEAFSTHYLKAGHRCWLIRTDKQPSSALKAYLKSVPEEQQQTKTCQARDEWWRFTMPGTPSMLFAQGFRGKFPKVVRNSAGAHAVGGVCGIYDATDDQILYVTGGMDGLDLRTRVVPYSSGFHKIEINQINALLAQHLLQRDA